MSKSRYELKQVSDNYLLIPTHSEAFDLDKVMKLNEVGAIIFKSYISGLSKTETMTLVMAEYDVSIDAMSDDYDEFIKELKSGGYID